MDEKKRKQIEARLMQLFIQSGQDTEPSDMTGKSVPTVVKVIRRRKGKSDIQVR